MTNENLATILDVNTLDQYIMAIGAAKLLKSVELFEELLPDYLEALQSKALSGDKKLFCEEAHKFKGAAGSVGLARLRKLSEHLQHGERVEWEQFKDGWLAQLKNHAAADLQLLKQYLIERC